MSIPHSDGGLRTKDGFEHRESAWVRRYGASRFAQTYRLRKFHQGLIPSVAEVLALSAMEIRLGARHIKEEPSSTCGHKLGCRASRTCGCQENEELAAASPAFSNVESSDDGHRISALVAH